MKLPVLSITDVAEKQLCCGCGACAGVSPETIDMIDVLDHGRRPVVKPGMEEDPRTLEAVKVCPGLDQSHTFDPADERYIDELTGTWGPILEMYEGYAADNDVRLKGSSGGMATSLALFCMEQQGMHGTLHITQRPEAPYLNKTVLSTSREQVVEATGSRYAPASPADRLHEIESAPSPCVFIGKPCDCVSVSKARRIRPDLDRKLGLVVGFFCAGTPTTSGTLDMLRRMGVDDLTRVKSLRYRGNGWPGKATVVAEVEGKDEDHVGTLTYAQSWGEILSRHKQWRCNLCPDRTGEFADIAVGDPWYRGTPDGTDPGRSLILVRTERGREILKAAIEAGYVVAEPAENWKLPKSQVGFANLRGHIWGRLLTLKLFGIATPTYKRFPFFRHWASELSLFEKIQSLGGTAKRVFRRRLRERVKMEPMSPEPSRVYPAPAREPAAGEVGASG
ncbi:MAG: Coenzyme F420 hydrogenase/dehydrogenase, beta subunit C-terminal domain [Planctomycetota bacterium]